MLGKEHAGKNYWSADVTMTEAASRNRIAKSEDVYEECALDLTCFVSCYNEEEHLVETLDAICGAARHVGLSYEIIVIDDHSSDGSREVVRAYMISHPEENIILRANHKNKGLAQNYIDGAFFGSGKYYRLVCGDNAEPRETLVTILSAVGQADCIVPYHVSVKGRGTLRYLISKTYTFIINAITGNDIYYYNGLAIHLRQNVMRWHTNTRGFGFQAEILCLVLDLGFSYLQIPVVAQDNRQGKSNALNLRNLLSVAHTIIEIANRRISNLVYSSR